MTKKSITYRLNALLMAFLMLFSTVGFSLDIHYCGGKIDNFAFYGKAKACTMMQKDAKAELPPCHQKVEKKCHNSSTDDNSISKKSCCDNENYTLKSLDESKTANTFEIANADITFVTVFILANFNLFESHTQSVEYLEYSPPTLNPDVIVLHQVFLI